MPHRLTLELPDRIRRLWYRYPVSSHHQQQRLQKIKNFRRHSAVKSMSVAFYFSVTQFRMYGHTYPEYGILPGSPPGQPPVPATCTRYPVPGTRTIPHSVTLERAALGTVPGRVQLYPVPGTRTTRYPGPQHTHHHTALEEEVIDLDQINF